MNNILELIKLNNIKLVKKLYLSQKNLIFTTKKSDTY